MPIPDWFQLVLLAAAMGAVGQLVRTVGSTVKHARMRAECPECVGEFEARQLVISAIVGALAGVLAALAMSEQFVSGGRLAESVGVDLLVGLAAAGYAGADFIEATSGQFFSSRHKTAVALDHHGTSPRAAPAGTATSASPEVASDRSLD